MREILISAITVFLIASPTTAWPQSAREIIETSITMDMQRKQSVSNYTVDQTTFGQNMLVYYEKIEGVGPNGQPYSSFRLVLPDEIAQRQGNGMAMGPEEMKIYARGIEVVGGQLEDQVGVSSMSGSLAMFVRAAATSLENREGKENADALNDAQQMALFASVAELVGTETVGGRQGFHVRASNLNYSQPADDGQEFIVDTVSLWIDTRQYVTLKLRMDGVVLQDGKLREMYLEKIDTDYRAVGPMYESYRQTMRMGGILDPAQEAELAQSKIQLEEFEAQKETMPPDQWAMMEGMIGPQLEMLRNMVNGGGIQIETIIKEIRVNAGLPDPLEMGIKMFQMPASGTSPTAPPVNTPPMYNAPAGTSPTYNAAVNNPPAYGAAANNPPAITTTTTTDPAVLQANQQSCLQKKIASAQASQKKKRGFSRLLSAVTRTAVQLGNYDVAQTAYKVYGANATAADLSAAAKDLGLTEDDVQSCQNPM